MGGGHGGHLQYITHSVQEKKEQYQATAVLNTTHVHKTALFPEK